MATRPAAVLAALDGYNRRNRQRSVFELLMKIHENGEVTLSKMEFLAVSYMSVMGLEIPFDSAGTSLCMRFSAYQSALLFEEGTETKKLLEENSQYLKEVEREILGKALKGRTS